MTSSFLKSILVQPMSNKLRFLPALLLILALVGIALYGVQPTLASHAFVSINDVQEANDQPGQKDLTKLEVDDTHAGLVYVNWNWDEVSGFSGANTGDACSLWDTDDDGLVNYALCVTIQDDANGVPVQTSASPRLYSCDESPPSIADRRCTSSVLIAGPYQSSSTIVSPSATDPFPAGADFPEDTQAVTVFDFDDIGGTEANLLNVCSYPSQIPNSDPSDCVVTPGAGFLTIVKVADPDDGTEFVFNASVAALGGANSWSINGSGDVQLIPYAPTTTLDLNEVIPSGWDLDSASCEIQTAIPTATGAETATGVDDLTIESGLETICTFNDVIRPQVRVVKSLVPSSDSGLFNLSIDGTDYVTDDGDGADTGFQDFNVGDTPTVAETAGTGTDLADYDSSISCDNGDSGSGTSLQLSALSAGDQVTCTITNTRKGTIVIEKQTLPDADPTEFAFAGDVSGTLSDGEQASQEVSAGTYSSTETVPTGWALTSIVCDDSDSSGNTATGTATFNVDAGETVTCVFTNTKSGTIVIEKQTLPDGDPTTFDFSGDVSGTLGDGDTASQEVAPGSYSSTETVPTGWDLTSIVCDDSDSSGDTATATATFEVEAGETVTCVFTNTKRGSIVIEKQTLPDGDPTTFDFTGDVSGTLGDGDTASQEVEPGTYSSTETVPTGWDLTSIVCDDDDSTGNTATGTATFEVDPGETVTCVFTNTKRGSATVNKTFQGQSITGSEAFTFQLRQGASNQSDGTVLATQVADSSNGGTISFANLVPGDYQLCEFILPGWDSTLRTMTGAFVPNSLADPATTDNAYVCVPFTVDPGETESFNIDNTPPPGGMAKTIGFWKNWSSCSGGRQDPILDETLASFSGGGVLIGDLFVNTCTEATRILNKSKVNNGKKTANDAAYGLAAQLLAAKLNVQAGAGACTAATDAITAGQALLDQINFTGTGDYLGPKVKGPMLTLRNQALALATTLDQYNNNLLCP